MTTDTNPAASPSLTQEQRTEIQASAHAGRGARALPVRVEPDATARTSRQVLDIDHPARDWTGACPVFIHGGGFRGGAAGNEGYLGGPLLGKGAMYVSMGYRLVPDARYPESCDDVEHGLRWLHAQIAEHGGDPERVYLSGTSAGATLAAAVALRDWVAEPDLPANLIKGLVLFSGPYDRSQSAADTDDHEAARFVPNLTKAIQRVPAQTLVISTDDDMAFAQPDADAMAAAIRAKGGTVERLVQPGADHFNSPRALADGSGAVFEAVTRMMKLG